MAITQIVYLQKITVTRKMTSSFAASSVLDDHPFNIDLTLHFATSTSVLTFNHPNQRYCIITMLHSKYTQALIKCNNLQQPEMSKW